MLTRIKSWLTEDIVRRIFRHSLTLFAGDAIAAVLQIAALALTARELGPGGLGILVLIQTYVAIVDRLFNMQSWIALIKYGAPLMEEKRSDEFKGLIKLGTIIDLCCAVLATIFGIVGAYLLGQLMGWSADTVKFMMFYSIAMLSHIVGTPTAILRLFDKFKLFSIQRVVAASVKCACVIVSMALKLDLWGFLLAWIISDMTGNILLTVMGWTIMLQQKAGRWWKESTYRKRAEILKFTFWTNLIGIMDLPIKQFDLLIVGALISIEGVALYKIFKQVGSILNRIADPLYQVVYPQAIKLISQMRTRLAINSCIKSGVLLYIISLSMAVLLSVSAPLWLKGLFGQAYAKEYFALAVYLMLNATATGFVTVHPLFIALGYVRYNVAILCVANLAYIVSAFYLGQILGLMGIIIAYGIQFSFVLIPKCYAIRRDYRRAVQTDDILHPAII